MSEATAYDVCFLDAGAASARMPMTVTGKCSGINTMLQKVVTMLFAYEGDPGRAYGTRIAEYLRGANVNEANIKNMMDQSAARVKLLFEEETRLNLHNLPAEERLRSITVEKVSLTGADSVSVELTVETYAGSETAGIIIGVGQND